jgi:Flp pilus assembly protein TadD
VAIVALLAIGTPSRLSHAWNNFQVPSQHSEHGTSRLTSFSGENRYQFWSSALREFDSAPLGGTGSGTFQLWWTRDGGLGDPLIDAHNLYVQTLGELGIVGLLLVLGLAVGSLWVGIKRTLRSGGIARSALAAAVAGSTVLWLTSIFDWMWKITIIPAATLLLIAVFVTAGDPERDESRTRLSISARVSIVAASLLALIAIAVPLGSESLVRQSQAEARERDEVAALTDARSAANVEPGAASPRLQEALVLESMGNLGEAREAAIAAADREKTNWRIWLVLSRIEAQNGEAEAAVHAYRKARALAPDALLFEEQKEREEEEKEEAEAEEG